MALLFYLLLIPGSMRAWPSSEGRRVAAMTGCVLVRIRLYTLFR